jgi:alpha-mannosidase
VGLVDGLLDEMRHDDRVRFTLDGQTATIDDYLEVRPEAASELARLVRDGRLSVGPWHILMDEFLVSGETIVRNLELGMRRASELGAPMRVGYLPDMFGHIAQMPQILRRAGITDAVVWRGVPHAIDRHVFTWRAPDGSEVRCEYLYGGYGNARDVFLRPEGVGDRLDAYVELVEAYFGTDELLAMYGEDHSIPRPGYAEMAARFNASQGRYRIVIETLARYLDATREHSRPTTTWTGELRSGARANVLMGVVSHHGDVRVAAARAETALERLSEPIAALHGRTWPDRYLSLAWRRMIEDSAHDSVCACSADEVVAQVLVRYQEAQQIARAVLDDAMGTLAAEVPADAWLLVSPSPHAREDLVELTVDEHDIADRDLAVHLELADGTQVPVQEVTREHVLLDDVELAATEVPGYLRVRLHGRELYRAYLVAWSIAEGETPVLLLQGVPEDRPRGLDVDAMLREIDARAAASPDQPWRIRVERLPRRSLLASVSVPPLGWASVRPRFTTDRRTLPATPNAVVASDRTLSNGLLWVSVAADGTLDIDGGGVSLRHVGRLVDGGDAGDAYNYGPPADDRLVDTPSSVTVRTVESGPLRASLVVTRSYDWPVGLAADLRARDERTVVTVVEMAVELRAAEPFVRLRLGFQNRSVDHRLRFHVPLPAVVEGSWAEGQFAIVARGLGVEGGHGEVPLATFPAHGIAAADGIACLLGAVTEYEAIEGREIALTLLRATGLISRDANPYRADPAGPMLATPSAQRLGPVEVSFALLPQSGPPTDPALRALERYRLPFAVAQGRGPERAQLGSMEGLRIDGEGVVMTALRRSGDVLELRLVNETAVPTTARIVGRFETAFDADLLGVRGSSIPMGSTDAAAARGSISLPLDPWQIRTLHLMDSTRPDPPIADRSSA